MGCAVKNTVHSGLFFLEIKSPIENGMCSKEYSTFSSFSLEIKSPIGNGMCGKEYSTFWSFFFLEIKSPY